MKKARYMILALTLSTAAHAEVACEAIKLEQSGRATLRGVRVINLGKTYVETHLLGDERAVVYFGSDSAARDRAGKLCWEVVSATRCEARTPRAQDQYANRGDPGFGPALWQKDSTKAATFYANPVSTEAQKHVGVSLSEHHGAYVKYYSECESIRASLAYNLLKKLHRDFVIANQPENHHHVEPVRIYDKF